MEYRKVILKTINKITFRSKNKKNYLGVIYRSQNTQQYWKIFKGIRMRTFLENPRIMNFRFRNNGILKNLLSNIDTQNQKKRLKQH